MREENLRSFARAFIACSSNEVSGVPFSWIGHAIVDLLDELATSRLRLELLQHEREEWRTRAELAERELKVLRAQCAYLLKNE